MRQSTVLPQPVDIRALVAKLATLPPFRCSLESTERKTVYNESRWSLIWDIRDNDTCAAYGLPSSGTIVSTTDFDEYCDVVLFTLAELKRAREYWTSDKIRVVEQKRRVASLPPVPQRKPPERVMGLRKRRKTSKAESRFSERMPWPADYFDAGSIAMERKAR